MKSLTRFISIFLLITLIATFALPTQSTHTVSAQDADNIAQLKAEAVETYADIVFASYEDSYMKAVELEEAIDAFVEEPTPDTMEAAKEAWLAAREPYGQTEAYRFYGGPIDDEDGPEGLINAWPLDEVYIDYVEGQPEAGIINNLEDYPTIDAELLESLNEVGAEENVSVGFHAIEFLLWGQDFNADGPGRRPHTDYLADGSAPNPERRGQYLMTTAELLVGHLEDMKDAWDPEIEGNYRDSFLAMESDEALQLLLTGLGVLAKAELGGERMFTAYDNQDQEDEHSCFSDNTHRDMINNLQGIQNVYLGRYERLDGSMVSGTSLADLMAEVDPTINEGMLTLLETADEQVNEIHVPFDQAIVLPEARPHVEETVLTLFDLGDQIAEVAFALDLVISTALPE